MSEVIRVTSEALQSTIRDLLPSQNGFGDDLMASNVIIPTIDLTASAEGSALPLEFNNALAFDSQTSFEVTASGSTTIINTTGFWRVLGNANCFSGDGGLPQITMTDGLASKTLFQYKITGTTANFSFGGVVFDFIVFVKAGESVTASTTSSNSPITGTVRQVADVNGVLTVPNGFNPQ